MAKGWLDIGYHFVVEKVSGEKGAYSVIVVTTLAYRAIDNLINIRVLPWGMNFEHAGFLVVCFGLGYVAGHHLFSTERKLLAIGKEIEIARRIQRSNLPVNLRSPSGLDIAARYVPMSTVAGDFYDIQIKEQSGVGILIADVSGHGVGAALIGSMLKVAFASQAECVSDPARVLTEINRILQGKIEESFVTACSLFIDIDNRRVLYANAGHPPPLLWRGSKKEMSRLPLGGTILGPFPELVLENATLDLAKGDRVILYTDGIIETKSRAGEFFGNDRLEAFVTGIPASYSPTGADTELAAGKDVRYFNGKPHVLEHAIHLDFALLSGYRADRAGNVQFRGGARNFNPAFAKAARVAVIEVDEVVEVGEIPPELIDLPGVFIDRVIRNTVHIDARTLSRTGKRPVDTARKYLGKQALTRAAIGRNAAKIVRDESYVNLGVGLPTQVSNYLEGRGVWLHAENGVLGYGAIVTGDAIDGSK